MATANLTHRQAQVLAMIRRHIATTGGPPTRAEIAQALGFRSINAAESHLRTLARKGAIQLVPGTARGIRLADGASAGAPAGLPLIGRVAAGEPILAEENIEAHYALPETLFHPRAHYLLRVRGQSMRDEGILDGDLLAVHRTPVAENGQLVVARLDGEVTVKRFHQRGKRVTLLPANPDFTPIEVDLAHQELVIEGLGVGVLRNGEPL